MARKLSLAALILLAAGAFGDCWAQEGKSPWGEAAGYYPGQAQGIPAAQRTRWLEWMRAHAGEIDAIGAKINAIKAGGRTPGCFGRPLYDCVASLAQTLVVTDWYQTSLMFYEPQTDVNGKPIVLKGLQVTTYLPGVKIDNATLDQNFLKIGFSEANLVNRLAFGFDASARTQEEYDRTGVFELFSAVAKDRCPAVTRNELARFIENKLKPALRPVKERRLVGVSDAKRLDSPFESFCGRELQLSVAEAHSTRFKKSANPTGEFGGSVIYIR
ncbi:hypothetical protein [Methylocapsa acidiphila]|uniref:hypothetical protein n=1 Tax=Methylocapsa acidiphila TaxID=133552 RepID=UPI00047A9174|nr:hypothetical protein [Methylocapsa acidiphila]